ncbi:Preprotein translocase secY subunit [Candidatus Purcelliella pentastirinorum]|uniref:Protein translocase subunit SecY n=1 Tax=Candidatus Purcelliella pentastirinorum TaxID=472834 RepID=A0A346DZL0_9ENTR|nr:preprotein translocase subunit SecY [Candidatus Purcelliella pentastirinorum]AXN02165.1 Preprotein translocase secY subunit [Candidatus Purcelliella pentastirinorum]
MIKKLSSNTKGVKSSFYELKSKLLFVIISLIVFRIGSFIPIPGIDASVISKLLEKQSGTIIDMFNMFSGGALSRASIFALGIMPYISASIIIQLLSIILPYLSDLKKEGELGRCKINQYIRYTTFILSIFQSIGVIVGISSIPSMQKLIINTNFIFYFVSVTSLVTGTIFLMWLGEMISEKGIGNGISIIIFTGIVSGLPLSIKNTIEQFRQGGISIISFLLILLLIFFITYFVIFIEHGQRRILVHYAKRQQGRRMYVSQSTHLPLKINMSGVIPAIFASSVIIFPVTLISWFGEIAHLHWLISLSYLLQPGKPIYIFLYVISIIFFCFFYTSLIFNPRDTSDTLKKSGAFIPGIRPGEQTAKYINKIMVRLTLFGSFYITFICLIPDFMRFIMNVPFYFGGTSLLIVVVVIIEFISQIQTMLMSTQYESALKKANLRHYNN